MPSINIEIQPNVDNDLIALINANASFTVAAGDVLRVQNKSDNLLYVHQQSEPATDIQGGIELKRSWRVETDEGAAGCRVTCGGSSVTVGVELVG